MSYRPGPRDLRASDADRERVVALLAEAAADGRLSLEEHAQRVHRAYTARTLGELAALTEDLAATWAQPLQLDQPRSIVAFFRREERAGRWVVPDRLLVTAVGGQIVLDVTAALLQRQHTTVQATLIASQLHLLVPPGVEVNVSRSTVGGPPAAGRSGVGTRYAGGREPRPPGAGGHPVIEIRAFTLAGQVRVHVPRRPGSRRLRLFPRRGPGGR